MKKRLSVILTILVVISAIVPAVSSLSAAEPIDNGNIKLSSLEFAYALRATKDNVSMKYDEETQGFSVDMPSNSKHVFLVSDTKTNGGTYTVSVEYRADTTRTDDMVALILGASKNEGVIDLKTAYKMVVYKASDRFRFSACDNNDPAAVGGNVSFDKNVTGAGVTYKANEWNTLSMTVAADGKITTSINGVKVYEDTAPGYIDGYVGLYAYVPGVQFRNFNIVEQKTKTETVIDMSKMEFGYALRGTKDNVYPTYNATDDCYDITMPSNSKHVFLVSDTKTNGGTYTVSVEYKADTGRTDDMVALLLGASKNEGVVDVKTAYKMVVYKNTDRFRFSACNNNDPAAVGGNVSFDKNVTGAGVTYKANEWNTLSMTVTKDGKITMSVNGVQVYEDTNPGYIDGYVGLYAYVPGVKFRNFKIVEDIVVSDVDMSKMELGYSLRGTSQTVYPSYNATDDCYDITMVGNVKAAMLVSDVKSNGGTYTVSVDYKIGTTGTAAFGGIIIGANKNEGAIDLTPAYRTQVYRSYDKLIFAKCDGSKPDGTASGSLNLTVSGKGVTYKEDGWNTMSITVNANGKITISVNGVQVHEDTTTGYIDGYVGLYAYVAGVQFRNFKLVEDFSVVSDDDSNEDDKEPEEEPEQDDPNSPFKDFVFGYALRATKENTKFKKNKAGDGYELVMPDNSKNAFYISNEMATGQTYTLSVEYKIASTDASAMAGLVLGAGRDGDKVDLTTAYKMRVYKNADTLRFTSCDNADPAAVGLTNVSFDKNITGAGVTYKANEWNTMSVTVTKDGVITVNVNGVEVYKITREYIKGYVGLYAYLPGTEFRNFKFSEQAFESGAAKEINIEGLKFAYALRATADQVSITKNETTGGYNINMPDNSKHLFLVSDTKTNGKGYTVSYEIQMGHDNGSTMAGPLLGVSKSGDNFDLTTAYKMSIYKLDDRFRFTSCDNADPAAVGLANVSFDKVVTGAGVTYKNNEWNKVTMTVTGEGIITMTVNGVEVYKIAREYISGYIGLYIYLPQTQIRNFTFAEALNDTAAEENTNAKFLYDFSKQSTLLFAEPTANTNIEYDSTVGAMKVSVKANNEARFYLGNSKPLREVGVSCKDYPIIAMRVKLGNVNSINGLWHYGTSKGGLAQFSNAVATNYEIPYQKTTEWQTIIIDTSKIKYSSYLDNGATWEKFSFRMFDSAHVSENDVVWVKWVAGFATEQEALEYSGVVTDEFKYVAVVGDGLTTGVKAYTRNTYPVALQTKLGKDFYVKQFATMGATAESFLQSADYKASVKYNPDIVVIMLGTNDSNTVNWKNAEQYKEDLTAIINAYKKLKNKPTIYLCTSPYIFDEIAPTSLSNSRIKEMVKVQKAVAEELEINLIDTYGFLEGKQEYYFNGLYLNNFGYPAMAEFIGEEILSTTESKVKEYIFKLDTNDAINNNILWNAQDDTEVTFDKETSSMKVTAKDATVGTAADGKMATNVAGFTLKLPEISTDKYPVLALHVKLSDANAMSGWYKFTTSETDGELSAKRPIYDATTEWQTIILDYSDPDQNTMISSFSGNWKSVTLNLAVDQITTEGTSFNVDWIGMFQSVNDARAYVGLDPLPEEEKTDTPVTSEPDVNDDGENGKSFEHLIWIIPVCLLVVIGAGVLVVLIIRKRRLSK